MNTDLEVFNISNFQNAPYMIKLLCTTLPNITPYNESRILIHSGYQRGKMDNTLACPLQADQMETCAYLHWKGLEAPTEVRIIYKPTCVHMFH